MAPIERSSLTSDLGVGSWIERRARVAPERVAIIFDGKTSTYEQLAGRIRRLAHGLRGLGVERGDRVAWLGPNHAAFLETLLASAKLGAVLAPVNHRLDAWVLRHVLEDSAPKVAVMAGTQASPAIPVRVQAEVWVDDVCDGAVGYEELIAEAVDEPIDEQVGLGDLCMLPYTSGTTGLPKGVMLTHGNITWNVVNFLSTTEFESDDVTIAIAPFFRVGGTGVNVLPILFKGGTVVIPRTSEPDEILRLIGHHRVSVGFGNPDLLYALIRSPAWTAADLSSIRMFISGGAPVPERLIRSYSQRGVPFVQGYGLSEAAPLVLLLDQENALRKTGSAGKPPLFVDVNIVRPDGTPCASHETGELLVRGPNVMSGYWNLPDETRRVIDAEGWLHTGDAARVDDEGYIWIVDRLNDAFFSSGEIVYPGDVERVLLQHPSVADAGVVGVDIGHGVEGRAFVVPAPAHEIATEDLLTFCRELLKPYEVPVSIRVVERLPRNSVGKLMRHELHAAPDGPGSGSSPRLPGKGTQASHWFLQS
jgi:acyl-CoA synthetase (AMP-forming)/AMP-acid ligase II